ncbi:MAG: phosphonate ABC transporter ATP-binding protein [Thiomonas sp.]|nr:phosphonate ABC transporter ATP-binding protein [Thiomonas sp.]
MTTAIRVTRLNKHFANGRHALCDIDLHIGKGEMVALIGASGSGKSTLMRHLAGLIVADPASVSEICINGQTVQHRGRVARNVRRVRAGVGMVFQQFNLVGRLPVLTNVLAGQLHRTHWLRSLTGWFTQQERAQALTALQRVGIAEQAHQRASTLSGGQQQRAAIARTLVQQAQVVLADEPIASLDPESSRRVMEILTRINREDGVTVLVSLHQVDMALRYCPRTIALHQGKVAYDGPSAALTPGMLRSLYGVLADDVLSPEQAESPPRAAPARPELVMAQAA